MMTRAITEAYLRDILTRITVRIGATSVAGWGALMFRPAA